MFAIGLTKICSCFSVPYLREFPYSNQSHNQIEMMTRRIKRLNKEKINQNLIPDGQFWGSAEVTKEIDIFYRKRTQKLCRGIVSKNSEVC